MVAVVKKLTAARREPSLCGRGGLCVETRRRLNWDLTHSNRTCPVTTRKKMVTGHGASGHGYTAMDTRTGRVQHVPRPAAEIRNTAKGVRCWRKITSDL